MKKIKASLFFAMLLSIATYAQTTKGTLLLGGSVSLSSNSTEVKAGSNTPNESSTSIGGINPAIGVFVSDNLVFGLITGLNFTRYGGINSSNQDYTSRTIGFNISPFARVYKELGEKISLFGNLSSISYGLGKISNQTPNPSGNSFKDINRYNYHSIGLNLSPGIVYFINNKWGIEATFGNVGYNYTRTKYKNDFESDPTNKEEAVRKNSGFNLNFNPSAFTVGLQFYLSR